MMQQTITAFLQTEYIELDKLLKRENLAASGGEARYLISEGLVTVNGQVETRKRRKIRSGDQVIFHNIEILIADPTS